MRDNALYFPFISVPPSQWMVNTLLYWDTVGSIVPLDHVFDRADGGHMKQLVQTGLVTPIFPREHLYQIPDYEGAFLENLELKRAEIARRDPELLQTPTDRAPIHLEKLQGLGEELVRLNHARRANGDWYEVDLWVANRLMTYLAAALGRLDSVAAAPVTDDQDCFRLLAGNAALSAPSESRLTARAAILDQMLPVPNGAIDFADLAKFKQERGSQLREFRREIEKRCITIAQASPADRDDALNLALEELRKDRDGIVTKMKDRWKDVLLGPLYSVVGAGIAVATKPLLDPVTGTMGIAGAGASLISTVYRAYRSNADYVAALNKPIAYAAAFTRQKKS